MRYLTVAILCVLVLSSCKDEINLPVYGTIDDTASPVISIITPTPNEVITGSSTQIPFQVQFRDDYRVNEIQVQIVPRNFATGTMSFTLDVQDSIYNLDTLYTIPSSDSLVYDVLLVADDLLGNVTPESYEFTTK